MPRKLLQTDLTTSHLGESFLSSNENRMCITPTEHHYDASRENTNILPCFQQNPTEQYSWSTANMHYSASSQNTYPFLRVDGEQPESSEIQPKKLFPTHHLPPTDPYSFNLKCDNNKRKAATLSGGMCQKFKGDPILPYMVSGVGNEHILNKGARKSLSTSNDSDKNNSIRYDRRKRILTPLDKNGSESVRRRKGIHINENSASVLDCAMYRQVQYDSTGCCPPPSTHQNQDLAADKCKKIVFESTNVDGATDCVYTMTNNTDITDAVHSSDNHTAVQNNMTHNQSQQSYMPSVNEHNSSTSNTSYSEGVSHLYIDIGDCRYTCQHCKAAFWYGERLKTGSRWQPVKYNKCCAGGQVYHQKEIGPPMFFRQIFKDKHFLDNIRAYNQMFSMTSFSAQIDDFNDGRGPYVFKILGEVHHWIGTICPTNKNEPKFMQLYIYDTHNEVANRLKPFGGKDRSNLKPEIVQSLIQILDEQNELVQVFRTAREKFNEANATEFKIQLYNVVGNREYQLPSSGTLGAIVFESGSNSQTDYDVIIEYKDRQLQRINKLHSSYMSLFPLLFVYGQPGYNNGTINEEKHKNDAQRSQSKQEEE
ncbi:hypothetical protein CTI12_AA294800 [Artemisia annua]|uniref:Helitron helicase-like domain-containing protein n=1 Tax=Artemisia annua TaxID=35608 RepID=A0A2U1MRV6_ARTAN|nr:hypothetical protein CTI12_AA294800 [Artemisia annua]